MKASIIKEGLRVNHIRVLSSEPIRKHRQCYYTCKCLLCGNVIQVPTGRLINSKNVIKSCGCISNAKKPYEPFLLSQTAFNRLKRTSSYRKQGISFLVSLEYLQELYDLQNRRCSLTSRPIIFKPRRSSDTKVELYRTLRDYGNSFASLDRIDNELGYVEGNLQWVCIEANMAKHITTQDTFIELCKDVYLSSLQNPI